MSASDIQTLNTTAQQLYTSVSGFRDAVAQVGTNAIRGVTFPELTSTQITSAINNEIKTRRSEITQLLSTIDTKLTALGIQ